MTKIIRVESCKGCPYKLWSFAKMYRHEDHWTPYFCGKEHKELEDVDIIPDWCPLENI